MKKRNWIADYENGLQKICYKDNIIATLYAFADWFSPNDIECPILEYVAFEDRKKFTPIKIKDIPDIIYSEIMRDVDLAVSLAHSGGYGINSSHSTVEMRKIILKFNLDLFNINNVKINKNFAIINGKIGEYNIHLGTGIIHQIGGHQINVVPVSSSNTSKIFLPFIDEDAKTSEILTKIITFANDEKIKDPYILSQIKN